jgi:hypothetical protein
MSEVTDPASRFLSAAQVCRTRDLERLSILGELVAGLSALIHGLQRERGASSIVLGSHGASFQTRLSAQVSECQVLERDVRTRLARVDEQFEGISFGARFYMRGAAAFRALDALGALRRQIGQLTIAPQDALKAFTDVIASLLAVNFEVADIAADPQLSRTLIALANFAQGKEYAGQERATAGAAFSSGRIEPSVQQRLRHLIALQDHAFRVFGEFAGTVNVAAFQELQQSADTSQVKGLRKLALTREPVRAIEQNICDAWFQHSTARIDAMKCVEEQIIHDLQQLCSSKLQQARTDPPLAQESRAPDSVPVAMLVPDVLTGGVGLYTLEGTLPQPMRSILDVVHAQTRRLNDVNHQLESARAALTERKIIERAKGLLMMSRRLSEKQAYALMRETAMSQNKRIYDIAEAIISMADILQRD